jgi:hypothetical protein
MADLLFLGQDLTKPENALLLWNSVKDAASFFACVKACLPNSNSLTDWQKEVFEKRLAALEVKLQNQPSYITRAEFGSATSAFKQVFWQYLNEVQEEKVPLLKNALIHGVTQDYELEERELMLKIVLNIQPLDFKVLNYLCEVCPNIVEYEKILEQSLREVEEENTACKKHLSFIKDRTSLLDLKTTGLTVIVTSDPNYTTMNDAFPYAQENQLRQALDNLKINALTGQVKRPYIVGFQGPYHNCIPTVLGQRFLNFVASN